MENSKSCLARLARYRWQVYRIDSQYFYQEVHSCFIVLLLDPTTYQPATYQ